MRARRAAAALWIAFAVTAWNVAFDRMVAVAGARFTRESVERHQAGEPPITIDAGYRPEVGRAAVSASLASVAVLGLGLALSKLRLPSRRQAARHAPPPER